MSHHHHHQQELALQPDDNRPAILPDAIVRRIEAARLAGVLLEAWSEKHWPKSSADAFTMAHLALHALVNSLARVHLPRSRIEAVAAAIGKIPPRVFDDGAEMLSLCWRAALMLRVLDPEAEFVGVLADLEGRRNDSREEVIEALQRRIDADRATVTS